MPCDDPTCFICAADRGRRIAPRFVLDNGLAPPAMTINTTSLSEVLQYADADAAPSASVPVSSIPDEPFTCVHCDTEQPASLNSEHRYSGQPLCETCYNDNYCETVDGEQALQDDACYLDGRRARRSGYRNRTGWYLRADCTVCPQCDEPSHDSRMQRYRGELNGICSQCTDTGDYVYISADDSYYHADDDGIYYWESDSEYHFEPEPENDGSFDDDNEPAPDGRTVYGHDHNPLEVLGKYGYIGERKESLRGCRALLLGIELEVDSAGEYNIYGIAKKVLDSTDFRTYGIVKEDGTCTGGEYVSVPADLTAHKKQLSWESYLKALQPLARGHNGSDNGMHVHINRAAVSPLTLGRMLVFMNNPEHLPFLTVVAQRRLRGNRWCPMKADYMALTAGHPEKHRGKEYSERYTILNVTANTVEVRMFKSTLRSDRLFKNLEFCDALVNWCNTLGGVRPTPAGFVTFLRKARGTYPNLYRFIRTRYFGVQADIEPSEVSSLQQCEAIEETITE